MTMIDRCYIAFLFGIIILVENSNNLALKELRANQVAQLGSRIGTIERVDPHNAVRISPNKPCICTVDTEH